MSRFATIGVYGWTLEEFLAALDRHGIDLILDVRQRRGVRGPQYAWANAQRLQAALGAAGVAYRHLPELAPTTELRQLQYREDERRGEGKRSRTVLAEGYREGYLTEILAPVDLRAVVAGLPEHEYAALLCVERDAIACHRSLIAARLRDELGAEITDLTP